MLPSILSFVGSNKLYYTIDCDTKTIQFIILLYISINFSKLKIFSSIKNENSFSLQMTVAQIQKDLLTLSEDLFQK